MGRVRQWPGPAGARCRSLPLKWPERQERSGGLVSAKVCADGPGSAGLCPSRAGSFFPSARASLSERLPVSALFSFPLAPGVSGVLRYRLFLSHALGLWRRFSPRAVRSKRTSSERTRPRVVFHPQLSKLGNFKSCD